MSQQTPDLAVSPVDGKNAPAGKPGAVQSPGKPPGTLSTQERRTWEYICAQLREAGIDHTTFGIAAMVVCKTYAQWVRSQAELEDYMDNNGGSYMVTTPNGYTQPSQLFYVVRDLKKELLQWLPECCLTIPSLAKARAILGDDDRQGDLKFEDLVAHGNEDRSGYLPQ